jgi:hypothetical protein
MAALLYGAIRFRMALRRDADRPKILAGFRAFLGLFWMTAPLAWLYAIPYEHFLSDFGAAQARVNTLGLVAPWRVLLMSRIIAVITESWFLGSLAIVMFFADAAVLAALSSLPDPLIKLMSGAQLSGRDQLILGWTFMARFMGFLSMPIWAITGLIALFAMRMKWKPRIASVAPRKWPGGAFYMAVGSLVFWIALLPITQPPLRLRSRLEAELRAGKIDEALAEMSVRNPRDFPPHWDPPPRPAYDDNMPPLLDVMESIVRHPPAAWIRESYLRKFEGTYLGRWALDEIPFDEQRTFAETQWPRVERLLVALPEGPGFADGNREPIQLHREMISEWLQDASTQPATKPATTHPAMAPPTPAALSKEDRATK